jgi:hypothetical protein
MNIRSKIMQSVAVGAAVAALAVGTMSVLNTKSIVIVAAILSVFCAVAAVCGLLIAESITMQFNASGDGRLAGTDVAAKRDADAADQAKLLAAKANAVDAAVKRMTKAANRIKAASAKNAKIIKRFNYTAIRAHLLAFRTTIKAARADEGGNGLAFIADEVRNFAQRCSMTAKITADMIEGSVKEADDGVKLVEDAAKSIGKIVDIAPVTLTA